MKFDRLSLEEEPACAEAEGAGGAGNSRRRRRRGKNEEDTVELQKGDFCASVSRDVYEDAGTTVYRKVKHV